MREETIGDCRLILGDCRDILPGLGKVEAICTDPPYEFDAKGAGIFRSNRKCMDEIQASGLDKGFDHTLIESAQFNSAVIFCHNDQLTALIPHLATEFDKYCVCFWHKENPMPVANRHYQPECEIYIHAWKKDSHPVGTLFELKRVFFGPLGKSEYDHPTVKPLALMRKIVRNMNAETICDPYMGTASTGVACVGLQKKFIGIEKEPRFFDIACRRIEEAYRQGDFFTPPPAKVKQDSFI